MRRYLKYVWMGSIFSSVEEFLTVVVLRGDLGAYAFTLIVLFPVFLTFVWLTSPLLQRGLRGRPQHELAHFFVYGLIGLLIEWFIMGLSPWSNPEAGPLPMLVFQLGMFSFWSTVGFAPKLFVNEDEASRRTRRSLLKFYIPYFAVTYVVALLAPAQMKFVVIIGLVILGYLMLNVFYASYFRRIFARSRPEIIEG